MFQPAKREMLKALVTMMGASGSGKTFSSLVLAKGIVRGEHPDLDPESQEFWNKIAVVDTEHNRSKIYAGDTKHGIYIGNFLHSNLEKPWTPEKYVNAIKFAKKAGIEVLILDSTTHAWKYLLEWQKDLGGRYQDWKDPDKEYSNFVEALTQTDMHIITTMRAKQKYAMNASETGKISVEKLGEQPIQRDDFEFEFLLSLSFDQSHQAITTKDNTPLFEGLGRFYVTEQHGIDLAKWLSKGEDVLAEKRAKEKAEKEEKKKLVDEIASFGSTDSEELNLFTIDLVNRATKTYGELDNLPLQRLEGFLNILKAKESELGKAQAEQVENEDKALEGLREVAKSFKIKGYTKMTKGQLEAAIKQAQAKQEKTETRAFKRDWYGYHSESDSYVMFRKGEEVPNDADFELCTEISKEDYAKGMKKQGA